LEPTTGLNGGNWPRWILAGFATWLATISLLLFSVDKRLAVTEGNRFTSQDYIDLRGHLDDQHREIMEAINSKANKDEVPPEWFLREFRSVEDEVEQLERDLKDHGTRKH